MWSRKWQSFCLSFNVWTSVKWVESLAPGKSDCQLTHLPLDKMATISQMIFSNAFFVNEKFCTLIKISLKFVPKGPIDNNPVLV